MASLVLAALFGLTGGLLRAVVGIIKHRRIAKKAKIKIQYFLVTLIISALIGSLLSLAFAANYLVYLVVGYAGIDLLENIIKIAKKKN